MSIPSLFFFFFSFSFADGAARYRDYTATRENTRRRGAFAVRACYTPLYRTLAVTRRLVEHRARARSSPSPPASPSRPFRFNTSTSHDRNRSFFFVERATSQLPFGDSGAPRSCRASLLPAGCKFYSPCDGALFGRERFRGRFRRFTTSVRAGTTVTKSERVRRSRRRWRFKFSPATFSSLARSRAIQTDDARSHRARSRRVRPDRNRALHTNSSRLIAVNTRSPVCYAILRSLALPRDVGGHARESFSSSTTA